MKRHFRDKRWQVRVHKAAQELRLRIRDETSELTQRLARQPTDADLAEALQVSEAEVAEAQLASQAYQVANLGTPITREQSMLMMRFYGNMTQSEIGNKLGISQSLRDRPPCTRQVSA